jgi:hypothetical protein
LGFTTLHDTRRLSIYLSIYLSISAVLGPYPPTSVPPHEAHHMTAPPWCRPAMTLAALAHLTTASGGGTTWDRIGPWNIFDDKDGKGESGTVACAASPAGNPNVIYAGGQNNGVSSGIIKTIDGGKHWKRTSKGLWDTRILGVWVHPDDAQGNHVCHRGLECNHPAAVDPRRGTASARQPGSLLATPPQAGLLLTRSSIALGRSWRVRTRASTSRRTARPAGRSATRPPGGETCRASERV